MATDVSGANSRDRLQLNFEAASLILAFSFIALFLVTSLQRFRFPFELEWMEGLMVEHVHRLLTGLPIYAQPAAEFTGLRYAPLYYYLCAPIAALFGDTLVSMRAVSIASTLGSAGIIFMFIRNDTSQKTAAFLGAGMFMTGYSLSDSWFDLARPDMLFILLVLVALYIVRFHSSFRGLAVAAVVSFLAAMAKQTAIPIVPVLLLCTFVAGWRRAAIAIGVFAGLLLASTIVGNTLTDSWYQFYVFELGASNQLPDNAVALGWGILAGELLNPYGVAVLFSVFYLLNLYFTKGSLYTKVLLSAAAIVIIGTSVVVRISAGSWYNTMIPAWTVTSLLFGMGYGRIRTLAKTMAAKNRRLTTCLVGLMCIFQFATLVYSPSKFVPDRRDRQLGEALVSKIASFDGPVWVPYHDILTQLAGKKTFAHRMAVQDIQARCQGRVKDSLEKEIRGLINSGYFEVVIIDDDFFTSELLRNYSFAGRVFDDKDGFYPVAGWKVRPESIFIRRTDPGTEREPDSDKNGK